MTATVRCALFVLVMLTLGDARVRSNVDQHNEFDRSDPHDNNNGHDILDAKPSIVGGVETPVGRYPYHVAYVKNGVYLCGGSLVDERWVLTAAHCGTEGTQVYVARHNVWFGTDGEEKIAIANAVRHPDYDGATFDNDYLLLELERPSRFDPVELDRGQVDLPAGADVTVVGWGKTSESGSMSSVLLEAEVDIVDRNECRADYEYLQTITKHMICAARAGRDACAGDSGGALIAKGSSATADVQVGLVSFGAGCADPRYPGVYARVKTAHDWIKETIRSQSGNDADDFWDDDEDGSVGTTDDDYYYVKNDGGSSTNDGTTNKDDDGDDDVVAPDDTAANVEEDDILNTLSFDGVFFQITLFALYALMQVALAFI